MEVGATTKVDVTRYYYQNGMVAYTTNESGNLKTFNYYGVDNNIIGSTRYHSGNVEYYLYNKDIQGSTTNILDEDGDSSIGYTYDNFGTATVYSVKNNVHNEITYTGAVYDNSTGLYYMNARYYDSEIGRFITQDTYRGEKDDAGTWHLYTYCANDPINYVDPSGHSKVWNSIKKGAKKVCNSTKKAYNSVKGAIKSGINKACNATKKFANWSLKKITKVENFGKIIDVAIVCLSGYTGFVSAMSNSGISSKAKEAGKKLIEKFFGEELLPALKRLAPAIVQQIKPKVPKIIDIIFIVTGSSIGSMIAKSIDMIDNKRNNGYVFTKY